MKKLAESEAIDREIIEMLLSHPSPSSSRDYPEKTSTESQSPPQAKTRMLILTSGWEDFQDRSPLGLASLQREAWKDDRSLCNTHHIDEYDQLVNNIGVETRMHFNELLEDENIYDLDDVQQ